MDENKIEQLREFSLFQMLDMEELKTVSSILSEKMYAGGMPVFKERDQGDAMYVIASGSVKISKDEGGIEKELVTLQTGDFFGEVALFEYVPRTATATTLEDATILGVTREKFDNFFAQSPQIVAKILYRMMEEMSRRLRKKTTASDGLFI